MFLQGPENVPGFSLIVIILQLITEIYHLLGAGSISTYLQMKALPPLRIKSEILGSIKTDCGLTSDGRHLRRTLEFSSSPLVNVLSI